MYRFARLDKGDKYFFGKNLILALTIKLIHDVFRNQEIHEKIWNSYEKVKPESRFFKIIPDLYLIPEFCHPKPPPTTLHIMLKHQKAS